LLEAASFVDVETAILGLPSVTGLFVDAVEAAEVGNLLAGLNALEDGDDLLFR
jgi:hypothetical protein